VQSSPSHDVSVTDRLPSRSVIQRGFPGPLTPGEEAAIAAEVRRIVEQTLGPDGHRSVELLIRVAGGTVHIEATSVDSTGAVASFSGWLNDLLVRRRLSQEAAARRIGVSVKTVSRWSRGETEPRYRELVLIQEAFGEIPLPASR
jgi:hypothetical protein